MKTYVFKGLKEQVSAVAVTEKRLSLIHALELIEQRTQKNPWNAQSLTECFSDAYKVIVLYVGELSQGFAVIYNTRFTTDLLTIGVDPSFQGKGYGRFLLECTLREALEGGAEECFLEVRVSNIRAQSLYKSMGFEIVGTRKEYYQKTSSEPAEDAYTMQLSDIATALSRRESTVNGVPLTLEGS